MREQTMVTVKISSPTLTAEEISTRIGLKPDLSWRAGTMRGAFRVVERQHGFVLESKLQNFNPLDEHVKEMLKRLAPSAQKIGELGSAVTVEFTCSISRRTAPALHFGRDELRWMAVMGAKLDIDTSIISDQPKGAPKEPPKPGTPA